MSSGVPSRGRGQKRRRLADGALLSSVGVESSHEVSEVEAFLGDSWRNLNTDVGSLLEESWRNLLDGADNVTEEIDVNEQIRTSQLPRNLNTDVGSLLEESWRNLLDGADNVTEEIDVNDQIRTSQLPHVRTNVGAHTQQGNSRPPKSFPNGVPTSVQRNPTSIFPPNETIILPDVPACPHCKARRFFLEPDGFCCCAGDIVLKPVVLPSEVVQLLTGSADICKHFRTHIRLYNGNFAHTSMGVKYDKELASKAQCGIYTFRVNGQIHHYLKALESSSATGVGLELYFYDPENELQSRVQTSSDFNKDVMNQLVQAMQQNPYAAFLKSLNRVINLDKHYISINCSSTLDQRTHNCPTSSEVAAIWLDADDSSDSMKFQRDVRVYTKAGESLAIREHYSCYDSLQYPIMFPRGEPGWHPNIMKANTRKRKRVDANMASASQMNDEPRGDFEGEEFGYDVQFENNHSGVTARQYYCYKLQMRDDDPSYQLNFGRLFQQFVVDMYIKIETMRLLYIRTHQEQFRVDFYQGIIDSIAMGVSEGRKVGKRVLLPASFIGGPRDMKKRYVDAMALVRRFGKPDIFLTMTCNANWPEVKKCVSQFEEVQNRPDLVARVFRAKVEIMKKRLTIDKVFGDVASLVYVIEYQKRGLPHAHFLIILKPEARPLTPDAYDRLVSAELPSQAEDPELHAIVAHHMIHGPCGSLNPKCVCMSGGKCKKNFPKRFCDYTTHGEQTYPEYRRRDNHLDAVRVRGKMIDNRWVVPYNPRLLREFNCHMNVEICCDIRAVKYLYKYVYKGIDKVSIRVVTEGDNVEEDRDEIKEFQSARWISPPEAIWRIYGFVLSAIRPSVLILQVHLPGYQSVRFSGDDDLEDIAEQNRGNRSMLTEFFTMNCTHPVAISKGCYYKDFVEHFVWHTTTKKWTVRRRSSMIGRLASVNPSEGERYYLRLLLLNVKAPKSFQDLLTVDNNVASTFREAANLRGLLISDTTFEHALEEASSYQLPYSLRVLFATMLSCCEVADPPALFQKFFQELSEDFRRANAGYIPSEMEIERRVLQDLDKALETLGRNVNDFQLGNIQIQRNLQEQMTREIQAEYTIPISAEDLASVDKLNVKQREIYDAVINDALDKKAAAYFIDGPGGTGKTFLYKAILARMRALGHIAIATASSGVAATLLPGGRTAHSRFKIPIDDDEGLDSKLTKNSSGAKLLIEARIIIWDETPMVNKKMLDAVNKMLRDFCDNEAMFGGKVMVFGGDFRQTMPIVQGGSRADLIAATILKSTLWENFKICRLTENIRAAADPEFAEFLMRIGNGTEPQTPCGKVRIPDKILIPYTTAVESLQMLIDAVYPDMELFKSSPTTMCLRAILTPKNDSVDKINAALIEEFPGTVRVYKSVDRALHTADETHYSDFLSTQQPSGMPCHELAIKVGCPLILLRNINPLAGFANGTRLVCKSLDDNVVGVEIVSGQFKGSHGFIPRIIHRTKPGDKYIIPFTRQQFPLRLAFAMTINKAQGQTLDYVGVFLQQPVFSHGQLYVALSRAKSADKIKVLIGPPTEAEAASQYTNNEVFSELLQLAAAQEEF